MPIGQSRSGRWWAACTRPGCKHYTSGLLSRMAAEACAETHEKQHGKEGR